MLYLLYFLYCLSFFSLFSLFSFFLSLLVLIRIYGPGLFRHTSLLLTQYCHRRLQGADMGYGAWGELVDLRGPCPARRGPRRARAAVAYVVTALTLLLYPRVSGPFRQTASVGAGDVHGALSVSGPSSRAVVLEAPLGPKWIRMGGMMLCLDAVECRRAEFAR